MDNSEAIEFVKTRIKPFNPSCRFAVADNGSAIARFDDGQFVAVLEKLINGKWLHGGLAVKRNWIEV
jgi:hypothetical protein